MTTTASGQREVLCEWWGGREGEGGKTADCPWFVISRFLCSLEKMATHKPVLVKVQIFTVNKYTSKQGGKNIPELLHNLGEYLLRTGYTRTIIKNISTYFTVYSNTHRYIIIY